MKHLIIVIVLVAASLQGWGQIKHDTIYVEKQRKVKVHFFVGGGLSIDQFKINYPATVSSKELVYNSKSTADMFFNIGLQSHFYGKVDWNIGLGYSTHPYLERADMIEALSIFLGAEYKFKFLRIGINAQYYTPSKGGTDESSMGYKAYLGMQLLKRFEITAGCKYYTRMIGLKDAWNPYLTSYGHDKIYVYNYELGLYYHFRIKRT